MKTIPVETDTQDSLSEAFKTFDKEGGGISIEQFKKFMTSLGKSFLLI